jgi:PEP-CTERM motif
MKILALAVTAVAAFAAVPAAAALNVPLAANSYISFGGLDWAWAGPCAPSGGCGDIDLSFQGTLGWRLPTVAEFALRPAQSAFLFVGANVPQGGVDPFSLSRFGSGGDTPFDVGSDGACAAAYFGTVWRHCDFGDTEWNPGGGNFGAEEAWVVRGVIPEPATWAMLIAGFGMVGAALRRRATATA